MTNLAHHFSVAFTAACLLSACQENPVDGRQGEGQAELAPVRLTGSTSTSGVEGVIQNTDDMRDPNLPDLICDHRVEVGVGRDVRVMASIDGAGAVPAIGMARLSRLEPGQVEDQCAAGPRFDADDYVEGGGAPYYLFGSAQESLGERLIAGSSMYEGSVWYLTFDWPNYGSDESNAALLIPSPDSTVTDATLDFSTEH